MIKVSYFPQFKGAPTLLISGDQEGMRLLRHILSEISSAPLSLGHSLGVNSYNFEKACFTDVEVSSSAVGSIVTKEKKIKWAIEEGEIDTIISKIDALCELPKGHHYVEHEGSDVQVIISLNEY